MGFFLSFIISFDLSVQGSSKEFKYWNFEKAWN